MSLEAEQKRRPPPIQIPEHRPVPGPNAFARAAKAQQDGAERQEKRPAVLTPITSPLDGQHQLQPSSQPRKETSSHGSVATAFGQLVDAARSPRKSGHTSSTNSRHGSTARSRHSNKSHRSGASSQPNNVEGQDDSKTARAQIEGRSEKRLFKIMGQMPSTPTEDQDNSSALVVQTGHYKKPEEIKSPKKKLFGMSFPASIAGFRSSANNTPAPPIAEKPAEVLYNTPAPPFHMPDKAAQVLGTKSGTSSVNGTPSKRRDQASRQQQQIRSDTSKSLPSKLYNQPTHSRRPNHHGTATSRHRTPIRKPPSPKRGVQSKEAKAPALEESMSTSSLGVPPTPPEKDTPRDESKAVGWALSSLTQDVTQHSGEDEDSTLRLPDFLTLGTHAKPVPSEGGNSPTKFCPYGAEEYAELVEVPRVSSTHAHVDSEGLCELEGDSHPVRRSDEAKVEMQEPYRGWWHKEGLKRYTQDFDDPKLQEAIKASQTDGPSLPPRFYSPSTYSLRLFQDGHPSGNTDPQRFVFALPPNSKSSHSSMRNDPSRISIDMVFQGTASEIDPTSNTGKMIHSATEKSSESQETAGSAGIKNRVMEELHAGKQPEPAARPTNGTQRWQPEPSSSNLTDVLNDYSPNKSGYHNDFYPANASALPSPLQAGHPHQMLYPVMAPPHTPMSPPSLTGTLADGSNVLTHFYMCNQHMDMLGRTIWDIVADCKRQTNEKIEETQKDTVEILEERFKEIKLQVESVGQAVDHGCEQSRAVNAKMDQLLEFIKAEVVEPLAKQSQKNADMENDIKTLQKSMHEMRKMVESKSSTTPSHPQVATHAGQSGHHSNLPNHRSQPSLVGYLGAASDVGTPRMPAVQETRNDGRFRYNQNAGYGHGQQWPRPSTAVGRDNKDENNPFPPANFYQYGSAYLGYGGGYYSGEHPSSYYSNQSNQSK